MGRVVSAYEIDSDDLWPRIPEYRFRLYQRRGETLHVIATTPTAEGVGVALATLDEDAREAGGSLASGGIFGLLDVMAGPRGRWLVLPWSRP